MRQIATHPGRMCSYFQCYSAPRLRAEHLGQALLGGRHAAFRDHLALLVQDAVTTASVAQIQPDGQPSAGSRFLARRLPYGVILLHGQSPFRVHLECVSLWERIASRRGTGLLIPSKCSALPTVAGASNILFECIGTKRKVPPDG